MYFGTVNGERYPKEIYNRLSKERREEFIEIDDDTMMELVKNANSTNSDIIVGNDGNPTLQERMESLDDVIKNQISSLKQFLSNSNYIAINFGALRTDEKKELFLATTSDTYGKTNEEILDEREDAVERINELKVSLSL